MPLSLLDLCNNVFAMLLVIRQVPDETSFYKLNIELQSHYSSVPGQVCGQPAPGMLSACRREEGLERGLLGELSPSRRWLLMDQDCLRDYGDVGGAGDDGVCGDGGQIWQW